MHPRQATGTGVQVLGQLDDGLGSRGLRVCGDDRITLVAALAQLDVHGDLGQQRHLGTQPLRQGTGDIAMSLGQKVPTAEVLVVTTPQQAASEVAERAGTMAALMNQKIIGVVENMSWLAFTAPDTGSGRVWGTSEIIAPSTTTPAGSSRANFSMRSAQYRRQRRLGSGPVTHTTG